MYDKELVLNILTQIFEATQKISFRIEPIQSANDFITAPDGLEKLDSICMLLIAIGESLKKIDKITNGELLSQYPQVDWKGAKGIRDIIAHQYFDIDAEEIFWVCSHQLNPLSLTIKKIINELKI